MMPTHSGGYYADLHVVSTGALKSRQEIFNFKFDLSEMKIQAPKGGIVL